jgi:hypothetical protein
MQVYARDLVWFGNLDEILRQILNGLPLALISISKGLPGVQNLQKY